MVCTLSTLMHLSVVDHRNHLMLPSDVQIVMSPNVPISDKGGYKTASHSSWSGKATGTPSLTLNRRERTLPDGNFNGKCLYTERKMVNGMVQNQGPSHGRPLRCRIDPLPASINSISSSNSTIHNTTNRNPNTMKSLTSEKHRRCPDSGPESYTVDRKQQVHSRPLFCDAPGSDGLFLNVCVLHRRDSFGYP